MVHPAGPDASPAKLDARASVEGVGAVTVGGRTALQVALSHRAGYRATKTFALSPDPETGAARTVRGGFTDLETEGVARLVELLEIAIAGALGGAQAEAIPLVIAAPPLGDWAPAGGGASANLGREELLRGLARLPGIDVARSVIIEGEHVAGARAMAAALATLSGPSAPPRVLVGGVDSYRNPARLERLAASRSIELQGDARRGDVFTPGEGAAVLSLSRGPGASAIATVKAVEISPPADSPEGDDEALLSRMITAAWKASQPRARWVLADINGEGWRSDEWARITGEVESRVGAFTLDTLGTDLGDMGAASAALYVAMAIARIRAGAAPSELATVAVADGAGERAIVTLAADVAQAQPATPRKDGPSPAVEVATVGRSTLADARRAFSRHERRVRPRRYAATIALFERADSALFDLARSELGDPRHLERFDAAAAAIGALVERLERAFPTETARTALRPVAEALAGIERSLHDLRRPLLDRIAAIPASSASGGALGQLGHTVKNGAPPRGEVSLLASRGSPSLVEFAPFGPPSGAASESSVDDDASDDDDDPMDAADDEADDGGADDAIATLPPRAPMSEDLADLLGEAIDTIGWLESLRRPAGRVPWSPFVSETEQRILSYLDAARSLALAPRFGAAGGAPFDLVARLLDDPIGSDEGRAFALALVLGSSSSRETVRIAAGLLPKVHGEARPGFAEGLAVSANPAVAEVAADLCWSEDPEIAALGAYVLGRLRAGRVGVGVPLLFHPDAGVRAQAAYLLAFAKEREAAAAALGARLTDERDLVASGAMGEALLRLRVPHAIDRIVNALDEARQAQSGQESSRDRPRATPLLRLVAVAGRPADWGRLIVPEPSVDEVLCLGWFGRVGAVEPLLAVLERERRDGGAPSDVARAAAVALVRISGAVLEEGPKGRRLVERSAATGDGAKRQRAPAFDDPLELDPRSWRAFWEAARQSFGATKKYRFGQAWSPAQSIAELGEPGAVDFDRRLAALEYDLSSEAGEPLPDTRDWAERQLGALRRISAE